MTPFTHRCATVQLRQARSAEKRIRSVCMPMSKTLLLPSSCMSARHSVRPERLSPPQYPLRLLLLAHQAQAAYLPRSWRIVSWGGSLGLPIRHLKLCYSGSLRRRQVSKGKEPARRLKVEPIPLFDGAGTRGSPLEPVHTSSSPSRLRWTCLRRSRPGLLAKRESSGRVLGARQPA